MALTSCKKDSIASKNDGVENKSIESNVKNVDAGQWQFAQTLSKALTLPEVRQFLKSEALKKFDADFDILYSNVRNTKLSTGKTFEETLLSFGTLPKLNSTKNVVEGSVNPLLNIYVYAPNDKQEDWNTESLVPKVAVDPNVDIEKEHVPIPALDQDGNVSYFESKIDPTEVVIVVGYNERVQEDGQLKKSTKLTLTDKKPLQTRAAFRSIGEVEKMWQINIPCLHCIEVWSKGSPELRYVSVSQQLDVIENNFIFDEDRSNFTPSNWFQVNRTILQNWIPSVTGNFMRHHWFEEDIGFFNDQVTVTHNHLDLSGKNVTYNVTHRIYHDVLGFATVRFGDITWTDYMTGNGVGSIRFYMGPF